VPYLYLISAAAGDKVPGIDIALVRDEIAALAAPQAREWMAAQGYGPDAPEEVMYLADEPGPDGFASRRVTVTRAERAAWQAAADEQDDLTAAALDDGTREGLIREMRLYRAITADRDSLVRRAHAEFRNINRVHRETGISRVTIYKILEGQS
jgi:hypothetical protein